MTGLIGSAMNEKGTGESDVSLGIAATLGQSAPTRKRDEGRIVIIGDPYVLHKNYKRTMKTVESVLRRALSTGFNEVAAPLVGGADFMTSVIVERFGGITNFDYIIFEPWPNIEKELRQSHQCVYERVKSMAKQVIVVNESKPDSFIDSRESWGAFYSQLVAGADVVIAIWDGRAGYIRQAISFATSSGTKVYQINYRNSSERWIQ